MLLYFDLAGYGKGNGGGVDIRKHGIGKDQYGPVL
jgi:hypothetical protein